MIFNIQRYSTHDGSGIRTVIFYKGCPLRCRWCSNPESQSFEYDLMYDERLCNQFGDCMEQSEQAVTLLDGKIDINRKEIQDPTQFSETCASKALTVSGQKSSVEELLVEIEKDKPFYSQSGGGVTLSGGEPFSQVDEIFKLLLALKEDNINVSIETSLYTKWDHIEKCLPLIDLFLVDLKHLDPVKFKEYTGGNCNLFRKNLEKLEKSQANIIIRIPVIPGFNDSIAEMKNLIDYTASFKNINEIHLIPYHTFGVEKYKLLGLDYNYTTNSGIDQDKLDFIEKYANQKNIKTKIGG